MVETDRLPLNAREKPSAPPLPPLAPGGDRFEAVDRLMAMATEKRADRTQPAIHASAAVVLPPETFSISPAIAVAPPAGRTGGQAAIETAGRVLAKLRPMLPAIATALRLVDHGAVQAAARLLPLLAGVATQPPAPPATAALEAALEARLEEQRQEIAKLRTELVHMEEQLTEVRWKGAQLDSEQSLLAQTINDLNGRVRVLIYAVVLLLPLVVALIALLFWHLRT